MNDVEKIAIPWELNKSTETAHQNELMPDIGGQRCPDSARVHCTVSVRQNLNFSVVMVFECPDFEFELDFDRQTLHSKSGQNPLT